MKIKFVSPEAFNECFVLCDENCTFSLLGIDFLHLLCYYLLTKIFGGRFYENTNFYR